ncbi:MAG: phenylalanine--tRNA ligase subunit beta [Thermoanaerobacteraceae bacterium]|nr:phenylalanine--tRNA ligase subunit beta [Thermoanaerobacteraceae bacterium]
MLVPLSWLKEFVDIDIPVGELCDRLTMTGTKVETFKYLGEGIENVVIGKILKIEKHPDADNLLVGSVDTGSEVLSIVTGATNIYEGAFIPVAKIGAKLPGGVKIRKNKLRGVESMGMMCSAEELGIDESLLPEYQRGGILLLPDLSIGEDAVKAMGLDDYVIEFEITPNRPDELSIFGIAREVAVTLGKELKMPDFNLPNEIKADGLPVVVEIEDYDLCKRYVGRVIDNIQIKESPWDIQMKLVKCGIRPINNIVDSTNYVMLELGQPLHAFDLDKVNNGRIIVRRAKEGEKIITIDHKERELNDDMLLITDPEGPIGVAGVMGGLNTEITEETKRVFIESANFHGSNIRRTSRALGLRSEASSRFEKGLATHIAPLAADRCAAIICELGGGVLLSGRIDVYKEIPQKSVIHVKSDRVNGLLGLNLNTETMSAILEKLEFDVDSHDDIMDITVPYFRGDIEGEADIAEEIARFYGYDRIPETILDGKRMVQGRKTREQMLEYMAKNLLSAFSLYEASTFSFADPEDLDRLNINTGDFRRKFVPILNSLGKNQSVMRTTLIPDMIKTMKLNISRGIKRSFMFELAPVYFRTNDELKELPEQVKKLCIGLAGENADFYDIKGCIEYLFEGLNINGVEYVRSHEPYLHPGISIDIQIDGEIIGSAGKLYPVVADNYDISRETYVAELDMNAIFKRADTMKKYSPLPKYPAVERDAAFIVDEGISVGDMTKAIKDTGGKLVEDVSLFDIYRGRQIPDGKKSVAFSIKFRTADRTLTVEEVDKLMDKIIEKIILEFKGALRG